MSCPVMYTPGQTKKEFMGRHSDCGHIYRVVRLEQKGTTLFGSPKYVWQTVIPATCDECDSEGPFVDA